MGERAKGDAVPASEEAEGERTRQFTDRGNVGGILPPDAGAETRRRSAFSRCADLENRRHSSAIGH